jgi:hypothetical protein
LAEPDTVVIAASTRRLTGELFEYRDLGAIEVKGIAAPVPAWQVLCLSDVASRFEALRGSALTPLVGRDEEIDLLMRRWAAIRSSTTMTAGQPRSAGDGRRLRALLPKESAQQSRNCRSGDQQAHGKRGVVGGLESRRRGRGTNSARAPGGVV